MEHPKKIGRYIIQGLLGEGAMGSVYKAIDPGIKRTVAIKTIKLDKSRTQEEQDEFLQRFFQEAQICGNLNHPNIVAIYDIGDENGVPYLALEYVEGQTLNQLVRGSVRPGFESLARSIVQIANALTFAHGKGIVHRDLKPSNIMITPEGEAKIMDFGIAKMSGSNLTQTGIFLGTPSYSSPEQVREGRVDHRSDIFALGILAHDILTGFNPFPGQSISTILYKIANEAPEPAPNIQDLPINQACWEKVFQEVLDKDPEKRCQNAAHFGQRLLKCIKLSASTSAELSGIFDEGPTTVRQAIGVEKQIQRSDFEKKHLRTSTSAKSGKSYMGLWLALFFSLAFLGIMALDYLKVIPEPYRVSQFFPASIKARFFAPSEISCDVAITSNPSGAQVFINDLQIDNTPSTYTYQGPPSESVSVRIQKDGYEDFQQTVLIEPESTPSVDAVLIAHPITVLITSEPRGAKLTINKKEMGVTPLEYAFNRGESYQVSYIKSGYNKKTVSFDPSKDHMQKLMVSLTKRAQPGKVVVHSTFSDLRITINGKKQKRKISLQAGKHKIQLKSSTYFYNETRFVTVEEGKEQSLYTPPMVNLSRFDFQSPSMYGMVIIDGIQVDDTPIINLKMAKGLHSFKIIGADGKILYQGQQEVMDGSKIIVSP